VKSLYFFDDEKPIFCMCLACSASNERQARNFFLSRRGASCFVPRSIDCEEKKDKRGSSVDCGACGCHATAQRTAPVAGTSSHIEHPIIGESSIPPPPSCGSPPQAQTSGGGGGGSRLCSHSGQHEAALLSRPLSSVSSHPTPVLPLLSSSS
jgi:hypothetical protein